MNTNTVNYESERRYLRDTIDSATAKHRDSIRKHFKMDKRTPSTAVEFVKLIQDGKFKYKNEKIKDDPIYFEQAWEDPRSHVIFDNEEADKSGWAKAEKELQAADSRVKLEARILEPEKALDKVISYEGRTFH